MNLIEKISDCYWGRNGMYVVGKSSFLDEQTLDFFSNLDRTATLSTVKGNLGVKIIKIEALKIYPRTYIVYLAVADFPAFTDIVGGSLVGSKPGFLKFMRRLFRL